MTERSEEEVKVKAGEERDFMRGQRSTIAQLYEQLQVQQKRKQMLTDRVNAYRMIKDDLREMQQQKNESLAKRLTKLNHRLNQEKN